MTPSIQRRSSSASISGVSGGPGAISIDGAASLGRGFAVFRADHQRAEQVDAILQIVVLDVDVDLDQIGMELGIAARQAALAAVGQPALDRPGIAFRFAIGAGAGDQIVQLGAERGRHGELHGIARTRFRLGAAPRRARRSDALRQCAGLVSGPL